MKKLICGQDVEAAAQKGEKTMMVDSNTLITPAARDVAAKYGVSFSECTTPVNACSAPTINSGSSIDADTIYTVLQVLANKGMLNHDTIAQLGIKSKFLSETDASGVKLVHGNTVEMDAFDTGTPGAMVCSQELISSKESKMSAGFLDIKESRFAWKLTYEEIDYVISGTLSLTINGKEYVAHAGDVLFVPSGANVVWGSPDHAHIFYTTYPANWASRF